MAFLQKTMKRPLSFKEKRIWDMWRRWRASEHTLYPWHYMTQEVYADDMIDLEVLEQMANEREEIANALQEGKDRLKKH